MIARWTKHAALGLGALALMTGFQAPVQAADVKLYPGAQCMPKAPNDGYYLMRYVLFLSNDGQSVDEVICPATRDNVGNTNGTTEPYVRVRSHNGAPLTCSLYALGPYGNIIASKTATTTSNSDASLNLDLNSSVGNGYYAIQCALPPGGRIYGYRVGEP